MTHLKCLRQIPVVQGDEGLNVSSKQRINELIVEVKALLVDLQTWSQPCQPYNVMSSKLPVLVSMSTCLVVAALSIL